MYVAVLVAAGAFYGLSCAPGALWQDSGLIQYRVWHHDIEGFLGLAISHPLYYLVAIVAKSVPLGAFAHRVNLVSALAAAVAVANVYLLVRLWLGRNFPAIIAAATLAFSHTFWRHACIAETYTLWTGLFSAGLVVLLQYTRTRRIGWLYALALLNGLAIAVHMLASIPLLCYAAYVAVLLVKKRVRARHSVVLVFLWIVGALPFACLIVKNMVASGDVLGTLASAAFGHRWQADVLNTSLSWRIVGQNMAFVLLNFPTPNLLLGAVGLYALHRMGPTSAFRNIILVLMLSFFVFAFRYTVSDRYAFFIPFYCVTCVVIGLGAETLRSRLRRRAVLYAVAAFSLLPVVVYAAAPRAARRLNLQMPTRQNVPYRDDYEYFLQPWKTRYRGAERFAEEALEAAEAGAVIYADTTTVGPLLYTQEVKCKRLDVSIVTGIVSGAGAPSYGAQTFESLIRSRPCYVTSVDAGYCPPFILDKYDFVQAGVLWRVIQRPAPGVAQ